MTPCLLSSYPLSRRDSEIMTHQPLVRSGREVSGIRDSDKFFRSLVDLLPTPAYLVFEGTSIAHDVCQLLQPAAIAPRRHIPVGTIFPRPVAYHIPVSPSFLVAMADLAAKHAEPEICDHLHAYDDSRVLLQWYDAFDSSMVVDDSIAEESLLEFCDALGATYGRWRSG